MGQDIDTDPDLSAELTEWALSQGATVDGIAAHAFPGKGLGIIVQRRLEAGDTILKIPTSLLRTESSLPDHLQSLAIANECSINGLLALDVCLDTDDSSASSLYSPWRSTLPSFLDVKSSMPLFWTPEAQHLLPPPGQALLRKQQSKLHRDWTAVSERGVAGSSLTLEQYTYRWLLVSTRTFYYTPAESSPSSKSRPRGKSKSKSKSKSHRRSKSNTATHPGQPRQADDCLAIVPFGDFFNHTASPPTVKATYSASGYDFVVTSPHAGPVEKGTELFISYGSHSNDFLLVEYGFILPEGHNAHDALILDEVVLPLFDPEQTAVLEAAGYLGNYVLAAIPSGSSNGGGGDDDDDDDDDDNADGLNPPNEDQNGNECVKDAEVEAEVVCYRTTTALRLLCMPFRWWKRGLECGFDEGDSFQGAVKELIGKLLRTYIDMAGQKIQQVAKLDDGAYADQKDVLTRRWAQILALLTAASKRVR
ncbi:hypothetical protein A1O7_09749 [Cladophialophora yegresii CBS 114405]|uniref:SET domain-containing protein n=1 Tax=Cladophialophora yegresii CBS 114405 TaxID=1182544 RepID=W9VN44_9EURO|nr:uncharacterized protein A1O7_09749 [Cladophialophora yegresii CBS 114405]EXJ54410.1 hypothetical protein A1O7_09749 [Cladophialophora yegresii CBS 114405]